MCTNLYGQEVLIFMIYLLPVLQNIMDNLLTVQEVRVNCKYHCFHLSAYHWFYSEYRIFLITSRYKQEAKKYIYRIQNFVYKFCFIFAKTGPCSHSEIKQSNRSSNSILQQFSTSFQLTVYYGKPK